MKILLALAFIVQAIGFILCCWMIRQFFNHVSMIEEHHLAMTLKYGMGIIITYVVLCSGYRKPE